jgi:hypothetical protein
MPNVESWLSPTNKAIWMKAFKNREKEVTIRDGRVFFISYETRSIFGEDKEVAKVWPKVGFAPIGFFRLEKAIDKLWLTEAEKATGEPANKYVIYLDEFVKSDSDGVNVTEMWPEFAGSSVETIRRGFNKAKSYRQLTDQIQLVVSGGEAFLVKVKEGQ